MNDDVLHIPVMLQEVLEALSLESKRGWLVDFTVGAGGHTEAILERHEGLRVLGLDRDREILKAARERLSRFGERVQLVHARWEALHEILRERDIESLCGALFDLGVSSLQLDRGERGFSFLREGPLDMRLDPSSEDPSAAELLAVAKEEEIARWLFEYGEERHARRIARAIVEERKHVPLRWTSDLVRIVERTVHGKRSKTHPATRTFQGIRIAVNRELVDLEQVLPKVFEKLETGARLAVLSYHSLEHRIVKLFSRGLEKSGRAESVLAKPKEPMSKERRRNPRSRSARLRALEKRCDE